VSNSESASDDEPAGADVRWSALTLDQLVEEYWETVAPVMRADDMDPESEHPPHRWVQSDFSGLIYTLREHHDRTVAEFLRDDVGITPHDGYEWDLDDDAVATALDRHVDALRARARRLDCRGNTLATRCIRSALRAAGVCYYTIVTCEEVGYSSFGSAS